MPKAMLTATAQKLQPKSTRCRGRATGSTAHENSAGIVGAAQPAARHPPRKVVTPPQGGVTWLTERGSLRALIDRPRCPSSTPARAKLVMSRGHDQVVMPHVPMPASERTVVRTVVPALLAALALGATPARCFAGVRLSVCANQGPAACATCACSPARPPAALAAAPARRAAAGGVRCSAGARDGAPRHAGSLPAVAAGLCLACAVALSAGPRSLQTHRPLPPRATSGAPVDS